MSPRKWYCVLCALTPKLKETLAAVSISFSSSFQRVASIVTVNVVASFLLSNTLSYSLSYRSPFRFVSSVVSNYRMLPITYRIFRILWDDEITERVEVTVRESRLFGLESHQLNGYLCGKLPAQDSSVTDPLGF